MHVSSAGSNVAAWCYTLFSRICQMDPRCDQSLFFPFGTLRMGAIASQGEKNHRRSGGPVCYNHVI